MAFTACLTHHKRNLRAYGMIAIAIGIFWPTLQMDSKKNRIVVRNANGFSSVHTGFGFVAYTARNKGKPPVELWCTGDDLFSQGMCKAFFAAFESSPNFDLQEENKPGNLIVTIPENVGWKKIGKRTRIYYSVEFSTSDERVFMTSNGWCWHNEYAT